MTIFLMVLKIIGYALLTIFLLLLAVVLLLLFGPFRYRIRGSVHGKDMRGMVSVTWLLYLFQFHVVYGEKTLSTYLRIFGWKKALSGDGVPAKKKRESEDWEADIAEQEDDEAKEPPGMAPKEDAGASPEAAEDDTREASYTEDAGDDTDASEDESRGKKWDTIIERLREKRDAAVKKLRDIRTKAKNIKKTLEHPQNKQAAGHIKKELVRLLKCIMPKKLSLSARFSTGAPDTTAQIFGVLAMFPAGYKNRWQLTPDFEAEEFYIEGDTDCKGGIAAYRLLGIVLRLLFDKNVRRLVKSWK